MKKAKAALSILLAVLLIAAMPLSAGAASISDFTDVKHGEWYYDAIDFVVSRELFEGTDKTHFSPGTMMDRGMFVTVLGRFAKINKEQYTGKSFNDVAEKAYYAPYVKWASENGIVTGTGNGNFNPTGKIERQQMATILYNFAVKAENDVTFSTTAFDSFPDSNKVSTYAKTAMQWATDKKIINGSGGKLEPTGTSNRAMVAQVMKNADPVITKRTIKDPNEPTDSVKLYTNGSYIEIGEDISSVIAKFGEADDMTIQGIQGVPTGYIDYFWNPDMGTEHCFFVQAYQGQIVRVASASKDMNLLGYTQAGATETWKGDQKDVATSEKSFTCGSGTYGDVCKFVFMINSDQLEGTSYGRTVESMRGAIGVCMTLRLRE